MEYGCKCRDYGILVEYGCKCRDYGILVEYDYNVGIMGYWWGMTIM